MTSPALFYYKPVLWAVENGITAGVSATQFGPDLPLAYMTRFSSSSAGRPEDPGAGNWSEAAVRGPSPPG